MTFRVTSSPRDLGERLCAAAEKGDMDTVKRLVEDGADTNYSGIGVIYIIVILDISITSVGVL
jgi:hypothetical protein